MTTVISRAQSKKKSVRECSGKDRLKEVTGSWVRKGKSQPSSEDLGEEACMGRKREGSRLWRSSTWMVSKAERRLVVPIFWERTGHNYTSLDLSSDDVIYVIGLCLGRKVSGSHGLCCRGGDGWGWGLDSQASEHTASALKNMWMHILGDYINESTSQRDCPCFKNCYNNFREKSTIFVSRFWSLKVNWILMLSTITNWRSPNFHQESGCPFPIYRLHLQIHSPVRVVN